MDSNNTPYDSNFLELLAQIVDRARFDNGVLTQVSCSDLSLGLTTDMLVDRKVILETELAGLDADQPICLHSGLAETYREQVANLTDALNDESCKMEAANHIRILLSEIRLVPVDGILSIDLTGIMALPQTTNARSNFATGSSLTLVAGVGFEPTTFRL